jgi:tetratricopeptide (TPR) repeat protein
MQMSSRPTFTILTALSAFIVCILAALTWVGFRSRGSQDLDLAVESGKARAQADRDSVKVIRDYEQQASTRRRETAQANLAKARTAWSKAQDRLRQAPGEPDLVPLLNEAFQGYSRYLDALPDDAEVRVERAAVHEIRRNPDRAIEDLLKASELKPSLAPDLAERIARLRKELGR